MELAQEDVRTLVSSIWEEMLQLPVDAMDGGCPATQSRTLSACVTITGAWRGAVALSCSAALASKAAVIMFKHDADTPVTAADQQDALGELVNMLGGNIKALLPEPCQLSLPSVTHGTDYTVRVPKTQPLLRLDLCCGDEPLAVSILRDQTIANAA